ncbi:MAG: SpoIIE family protein phosphatase [Gemmataceae bacterium]|nr:SpoIIE family protein phosphatase [Gemmataceae bacterium]
MASLTILKGLNPGQRISLDGDEFILGRDPKSCQIHIPNNAVSRQHAKILRVDQTYYIEDLESRNGTWVNNQEIRERTPLKNNDRIKICDFLFSFNSDMVDATDVEFDDDAADTPSTVHASIGRMSQQQLLEAQPSDRLRALLQVSATLNKTLQEESLLPRIAEILFNVFKQADRCFVIIREERDGQEVLIPKVIKTRRANAETTARFSKSIVRRVLDSGQSLLFEDAQSGSQMSLSASIAEFRIRSGMCAPLMNQEGTTYGLIQLDSQDRQKTFTQDDLNLLVAVANQAAVALENARLHKVAVEMAVRQKDEQLAKEVQRSFLPATLPNVEGYAFYAFYQAAKSVGGDYYDFIAHDNGRKQVILLGDVAGKGMPAALLMAKLSAEARYCLLMHPELHRAIGRLNDQLLNAGMMDRFVTLSACLLDPETHTITMVSAGHESPLVFRSATNAIEFGISRDQAGFPLGMMEGAEYEWSRIALEPGDAVFVFTDGVTDALDLQNKPFGLERVKQVILAAAQGPPTERTPQAMGRKLITELQRYTSGQFQNDDIALVCFGRTADGESNVSQRFVATPTMLATQPVRTQPNNAEPSS